MAGFVLQLEPRCYCGARGTKKMGDPQVPRQKGFNSPRPYWMCDFHASLCRYLVPWESIPTQHEVDMEFSGLPGGVVVECSYKVVMGDSVAYGLERN